MKSRTKGKRKLRDESKDEEDDENDDDARKSKSRLKGVMTVEVVRNN